VLRIGTAIGAQAPAAVITHVGAVDGLPGRAAYGRFQVAGALALLACAVAPIAARAVRRAGDAVA
jgi:hypothetical protein